MIVGINASRARSGGAVSHLVGIITEIDWIENSDLEIHIWTHKGLSKKLPSHPFIKLHISEAFEQSIVKQIIWEKFILPRELKKYKCDILLNIDAGSVARYSKMVTMSRDMLSYEPGEMDRFRFSVEKIRLILLKYIQNSSLRASNGVVFLTHYAGKVIQESCGKLRNVIYIPHGVGKEFLLAKKADHFNLLLKKTVDILYVSNIAPYKHQWNVVRGIANLRSKGFDVRLTLTGGGHVDSLTGSQRKLDEALEECDPNRKFVKILGYVSQSDLPQILCSADIFVFASSCENMPNTLIEAMSVGLPIACSNRGPMPEVLKDAGVYFNPDCPISIANSIESYLKDELLVHNNAINANQLSRNYSWERCSRETFAFLRKVNKLKKYN
ncbi:MAG: glycosyltransferase family 4 protein [Flavobacterium sp.]|uniref:glycosyltransferase family 4 protein n=1 Tax=Flavobacterium sp. TaxID=239 RepID=UPI003BCFBD7B